MPEGNVEVKMEVKHMGGEVYQLPPELGSVWVNGKDEVAKRIKAWADAGSVPVVKDKIALIGYAPSRDLVPWDDPTVYRVGLNDLYRVPGMAGPYDCWFQLHNKRELIRMRSPEHLKWLREQALVDRILMQNKVMGIPASEAFPIEALVERWRDYYTNSISYMIAWAIMQAVEPAPAELQEKYGIEWVRKPDGFKEIHLYGIDMAAGSEFEYQRASVEYFVGLAEGMGFRVHIPLSADILKTPRRYGYEGAFTILDKFQQREQEQAAQIQQARAELDAISAKFHQFVGASNERSYWQKNWTFDVDDSQEWSKETQ